MFGPDENTSNKLQRYLPGREEILDCRILPGRRYGRSELSTDGRVIEMLSEHTMEGMLEGYLLTGRNGFFSPMKPSFM